MPSGPPEAPQSCELNVTSTRGLLVKCLGGFDGGLPQHYTVALYSSKVGAGAAAGAESGAGVGAGAGEGTGARAGAGA